MSKINRQWVLKHRPEGEIRQGDLQLVETEVPDLKDGEALVRTVYLSLDPTNRIWMSDMDQYMPPVEIGEVMRGGTLGIVEESRFDGLAPGDVVPGGLGGWQDYMIAPGETLQKLPADTGLPLTAFMSVLGATGMTAYFGLLDVAKPQPGETVVVSAAAGAVGSIVGQIAKIKGCRAVGLAGSDEKCRWLTEELGYDAAINYKTGNVLEALKTACPDGIDVYFENVGGEILDAVLTLINQNARISLCGLISTYNATEPVPGPYMFRNILMKRATVKGFIIIDYLDRFPEGIAEMAGWIMEGKIKWKVDVVDGLENAPSAVGRLFTGANTGKLLVKVSDDPTA